MEDSCVAKPTFGLVADKVVVITRWDALEEWEANDVNVELSLTLLTHVEVVPQKYFLIFDINGTLIHFFPRKILSRDTRMKKSERRFGLGLVKFLHFCVNYGFEIIFSSSIMEYNLISGLKFIQTMSPVFLLIVCILARIYVGRVLTGTLRSLINQSL